VDAGQITLGTFEGQSYNYMQFRTAAGGLEIGTIAIDQAGELSSSGYNLWLTTANDGGQSPNVESGTPALGSAMLVVSSDGAVTITDANGTTLASGALTAVADTSYLYGTAGELADPCYGLFTFRSSSGNVQQDVFVTFLGKSAVFSSFSAVQPSVPGETYDYFYGVGLVQAQ